MGKKEDILIQLRNAKKAHLKWVHRARALTEGLPVEKDAIPMDSTECVFGQWFYGDGQAIALLPGMDCFKLIEAKHDQLHDAYMKIFKIYFGEMNRSFFSKLFNLKKKISQNEHEIAIDYYAQLKAISEELLAQIEKLERRINAMTDDQL